MHRSLYPNRQSSLPLRLSAPLEVQYDVVTTDQTTVEQPPRISAYTSASQRQEAAQFLDPLSVHQLLDEIAEQHQTLKAKLKK